ncbi:HPF/RaiA family ribosome-associated protein [Aurantibacter crassamenti]|uniref:HPF/RaiA family ribosome-associated protein n=1 Tax=Aurantibacter crassamenti TaxID=1837375 RepID=UPI00193A4E99|nr:HPF/RaiA family ribosome-associated protein [Aurantibacter crassamenti]MBM1107200.1 HPF/RaiA family ribosome-associated protein [Aurantibacter crassamenti]
MNIIFEYHNVTASARLEEFTTKHINKLFDKYDFIVRADVFFKTENVSEENKGKICNIRLSAPGPRLFSESSTGSFEASAKESIGELERQLSKRKDKLRSH